MKKTHAFALHLVGSLLGVCLKNQLTLQLKENVMPDDYWANTAHATGLVAHRYKKGLHDVANELKIKLVAITSSLNGWADGLLGLMIAKVFVAQAGS